MTQEDKQLLLKDLSARLPYGVMVRTNAIELAFDDDCDDVVPVEGERDCEFTTDLLNEVGFGCYDVRPYLRPISSMTDEEWRKMHNCCNAILMGDKRICIEKSKFGSFSELQDAYTSIDWLNAHHFDYRGLIEKGLALPAPEGMYNIKDE